MDEKYGCSQRTPRAAPRILVAEDDDLLRFQIARAVRELGWSVREARDGRELLALLDEQSESAFEMLVTDVRMPRVDGLDLLAELARRGHELPVVVVTAFADEQTLASLRVLGASMTFSKPFDVDDLCTALLFLYRSAGV